MRTATIARHVVARAMLLAAAVTTLPAQTVSPGFARLAREDSAIAETLRAPAYAAHRLPTGFPVADSTRRRRAPLWAPIASLVAPGAGQLSMRQARGVGYLAVEAYAWIQFAEAARDARARRGEYRRTAREVARAAYGGGPDAAWTYYEALKDRPASGAYNRTPGGALTPEIDTSTFNGAQWLKAREIFWNDPDVAPPPTDVTYQRAIDFYQKNAWGEGYLWSWRDQQVQWDLYKATIARENQSTRDMTTTVAIIIANHLLSGVDALANVRLRRMTGAGGERRIEASLPWPAWVRRPQ